MDRGKVIEKLKKIWALAKDKSTSESEAISNTLIARGIYCCIHLSIVHIFGSEIDIQIVMNTYKFCQNPLTFFLKNSGNYIPDTEGHL